MQKTWDGGNIAQDVETWKKAFNLLKPGGYMLALGGTRSEHRMTCAIEDAGFIIADKLMWLYCSGFPKSFNLEKQIDKTMRGCPQEKTDPKSDFNKQRIASKLKATRSLLFKGKDRFFLLWQIKKLKIKQQINTKDLAPR